MKPFNLVGVNHRPRMNTPPQTHHFSIGPVYFGVLIFSGCCFSWGWHWTSLDPLVINSMWQHLVPICSNALCHWVLQTRNGIFMHIYILYILVSCTCSAHKSSSSVNPQNPPWFQGIPSWSENGTPIPKAPRGSHPRRCLCHHRSCFLVCPSQCCAACAVPTAPKMPTAMMRCKCRRARL